MAVLIKNDQQLYKGRGPLDSKSLVKTYAELLDVNTWTKEDTLIAYNGMIVAVWLNKNDTSKNGVYFLFDPSVTTAIKKPDVANEANWHRFADFSDVAELSERLVNVSSTSAANIAAEKLRAEAAESELEQKIFAALEAAKAYADANDANTIYDDTVLAARISALAEESKNFATKAALEAEIEILRETINNISHFRVEVVDNVGAVTELGVLYLIKDEAVSGADKFNEYIVVNGIATLIGDTTVDLGSYYTKAEVDIKVADLIAAVSAVDRKLLDKVDNSTFDAFQATNTIAIASAKQEAINTVTAEVAATYATKAALEAHAENLAATLQSYVTSNDERVADVEAAVNAQAESIAAVSSNVSALVTKMVGIDGTVANYVANKISAITVPKASKEVTVAEDGTLGIGELTTDKLVQGKMTLVLCGGDAD